MKARELRRKSESEVLPLNYPPKLSWLNRLAIGTEVLGTSQALAVRGEAFLEQAKYFYQVTILRKLGGS